MFTFLMNYEKYSFPEAVYVLARRLGIRLPERIDKKETEQLQRTDTLYQLHREVANFFVYQLKQSPQAQHAREYLRKRDIGQATIEAFGIGYAPSGWDDIQKHFPNIVFKTVIPRSVRIAEAPSYGKSVIHYRISSSGAQAYLNLTRELLNHA